MQVSDKMLPKVEIRKIKKIKLNSIFLGGMFSFRCIYYVHVLYEHNIIDLFYSQYDQFEEFYCRSIKHDALQFSNILSKWLYPISHGSANI
jgi:hypothetical protein